MPLGMLAVAALAGHQMSAPECGPSPPPGPVYTMLTAAPKDGLPPNGWNMNIMTEIAPLPSSRSFFSDEESARHLSKYYTVRLYHGTESRANFYSKMGGVVQQLAPRHAPLVRVQRNTRTREPPLASWRRGGLSLAAALSLWRHRRRPPGLGRCAPSGRPGALTRRRRAAAIHRACHVEAAPAPRGACT